MSEKGGYEKGDVSPRVKALMEDGRREQEEKSEKTMVLLVTSPFLGEKGRPGYPLAGGAWLVEGAT
jgi:hypothetical protein